MERVERMLRVRLEVKRRNQWEGKEKARGGEQGQELTIQDSSAYPLQPQSEYRSSKLDPRSLSKLSVSFDPPNKSTHVGKQSCEVPGAIAQRTYV